MTSVILVVEDQLAMQRTMQLGLEMAGYEVLTAADGVEALELLKTQAVDLILADIAMPRMNGYQLYEVLCRHPRWALIPFVFVSARVLDSDIRYGKALGVDDYLTKPFDLEDLLAIVAGRLRRAQQLARTVASSTGQPLDAVAAPAERVEIVTAGPLRISHEQHRVWKDGKLVALAPREFILLEYLARRPDQAVSLMDLCQATHGLATNDVEAGNLIYPLIRSLRRRLGLSAGEKGCIESVRGIGYRLVTQPEV